MDIDGEGEIEIEKHTFAWGKMTYRSLFCDACNPLYRRDYENESKENVDVGGMAKESAADMVKGSVYGRTGRKKVTENTVDRNIPLILKDTCIPSILTSSLFQANASSQAISVLILFHSHGSLTQSGPESTIYL